MVINVPMNRVEGDLEVRVELSGGTVVDAWSSGVMYRGFERILLGRGALDSLVITPRVCGICSTAHLMAACRALDMICGAKVPQGAIRIRNLTLMAEQIQSDLRHAILIFMSDLCNPGYQSFSFYREAIQRYEPFRGERVVEVIQQTKRVLEIIAILGGQWPHSSYMVPGGITAAPTNSDILQCRLLLADFLDWFEKRILGCALERWQQVQSRKDLEDWLEEQDSHRLSDVGFFVRVSREAGLEKIGRGVGRFLSYGSLPLPEGTSLKVNGGSTTLIPAGFAEGTGVQPFDQEKISEHVSHSWYRDEPGPRHPFHARTEPHATGEEGRKYSWAKAPRYDGLSAETGPLAERILSKNPLFLDLIEREGPSVFVRELARLTRSAEFVLPMMTWLSETIGDDFFYSLPREPEDGEGFGLIHGARGALGHWMKIRKGRISHYQIITPTTWNASPRDEQGARGPWEEALIGTPVCDPANPLELGHIVRSFDACLVCAVHTIQRT